jgi:hypothetical protein
MYQRGINCSVVCSRKRSDRYLRYSESAFGISKRSVSCAAIFVFKNSDEGTVQRPEGVFVRKFKTGLMINVNALKLKDGIRHLSLHDIFEVKGQKPLATQYPTNTATDPGEP